MIGVKFIRMIRGFSQEQLARKCGMTQVSISLIEKGKTNPHAKSIEKIANALGVSSAELSILNHAYSLPDKTRDRIYRAIEDSINDRSITSKLLDDE